MSNAYIKTLKDGNGNIVYPQTKTGAIYRNDNSASLDSLLDAAVYMNAEEEGITPVTRDADTLGGYPASDYAKKDEVINTLIHPVNASVVDIDFVDFTTVMSLQLDVDNASLNNWLERNESIRLNLSTENLTIELILRPSSILTGFGLSYTNAFNTLVLETSGTLGGVITYSLVYLEDRGSWCLTSSYINGANKPTISNLTLLASGWSGNTYDLGNEDSNVEIELDSSATEEMIEAWTNAKILGSATSNILTAKGDVPTIDITCIMKRTVK